MEQYLKRRAALYTLIRMVDENKGVINVNTEKIKRIFNDENEIVMVEYADGLMGLLADLDFETMNGIISKVYKDKSLTARLLGY